MNVRKAIACATIALAVCLGGARPVHARDYGISAPVTDVEALHQLASLDELADDELDALLAMHAYPVDINRADRHELFDLPDITSAQAAAVVEYRSTHGPFVSVAALSDVPGMDEQLIAGLRLFAVAGHTPLASAESSMGGRARVGMLYHDNVGLDLRRSGGAYDEPNSYLSVRGSVPGQLGFGGLVTQRPVVRSRWDYSRGGLTADGEKNSVLLDSLYAYGLFGPYEVVVGNYNAGFGQRLTFDTTAKTRPNGWEERIDPRARGDEGDVRPHRSLRGIAVSARGMDLAAGWVDATAFGSYQTYDLSQDDLWYGPDEFYATGAHCETDGDCPDGFTCRPTRQCFSTRVYDEAEPSVALQDVTHRNGVREALGGGSVRWNLDAWSYVGAVAYASSIGILAAPEVPRQFSLSSRYPSDYESFGAVGVEAGWGHEGAEVAGEVTATRAGGAAGVVRASIAPTPHSELELTLRGFEHDFENPYARATTSRLEVLGSRHRAQRGAKLQATLKPWARVRMVTSVDTYQTTATPFTDTAGTLHWESDNTAYMRAIQRISWGLTGREEVAARVSYSNNDLAHNARTSEYVSGDRDSQYRRTVGQGEKRSLLLRATSRRVRGLRVSAEYYTAWEDVKPRCLDGYSPQDDEDSPLRWCTLDSAPETVRRAQFSKRFDHEQFAKLTVGANPRDGTRITATARWWFDEQVTADSPARSVRMALSQRLLPYLSVRIAYGVVGEEREAGLDWLHWGTGQIDYTF